MSISFPEDDYSGSLLAGITDLGEWPTTDTVRFEAALAVLGRQIATEQDDDRRRALINWRASLRWNDYERISEILDGNSSDQDRTDPLGADGAPDRRPSV